MDSPSLKYTTVLFDLDGTLLDTVEDLGAAVNHALTRRNLEGHDTAFYRRTVGHGIADLVRKSLPASLQDDEPMFGSCLDDFKRYYTAHIDVHTRPYPGIPDLLIRLHRQGISLAITSNKFQEGTERLAAGFFPGIPFAALLGNRPGAPLKPDPAIVREVLRVTGSPRERTVLVGDSGTDMQTAANGGIARIAVNWGYRPMKGTPGLTVVETVAQLEALLL